LPLHPSHQRDTAHRPIGTGRLRARRRFGYGGEQIGRLRDQNDHHLRARRQNSSLNRGSVSKQLWKTLSLPIVRRLIAKEQHQGRGFEFLPPLLFPLFATPTCDVLRFRALDGNGQARGLSSRDRTSQNERLWNGRFWRKAAVRIPLLRGGRPEVVADFQDDRF